MNATLRISHGVRMLVCAEDGPTVADEAAVTDLIGEAGAWAADLVVIPVARLDERFFTLSSGLAGMVLQKLVNYRLRLVVVGDISAHLARSNALRDLVRESNRGRQAWFLADVEALDARLRPLTEGT